MKLLVLGGTADARTLAEALVASGEEVLFSVAGEEGKATVPAGAQALVGRREKSDWIPLLATEGIDGVIDASHPFAVRAGQALAGAAEAAGLPCLRYERPEVVPENALLCRDAEEALTKVMEETSPGEAVFLTVGVRLLPVLVPPLRQAGRSIIARVLPSEESLRLAREAGLAPKEILALYGHGSEVLNESLFREFGARVVLSKSSGAEGGVPEKARAAAFLGVPFVLIARPGREGQQVHDVAAVLDAVALWKKEVQG